MRLARLALPRALLLAALLAGGMTAAAPRPAPPSVASLDPPSWWVGHSYNPIQLLVRGRDLAGARLVSETPEVAVVRQQAGPTGGSLIAYARIEPGARPGPKRLRVDGPGGSAALSLELLAPAEREGRFQGLTPDDVVYLVMPDRFADADPSHNPAGAGGRPARALPRGYHGGDLLGLAARLPYLEELGVTTVWFTPVYDNDDAGSSYHGYHATDFYAVEERFGTIDEMRALVDAAHRRGLKVMQDQVANHTGETHPWLDAPPTATWYNGTRESHLDNAFVIASVVDPAADPAVRRATLEGWFGNHLPDLNQNDPDAAAYLVQNSLWWVGQTGIDAIRQDTLPYVPRAFWSEWIRALRAEFPRVTVLGEVFNGDPKTVSYFQGGVARDGVDTRVDQLFDFPLHFVFVEFLSRRGSAARVAEILAADPLYPNPLGLVVFVGNHDTPRAITLLHGDPRALRLAHVAVATMRGIPQVYYGDEIGLPGGGDPDNRRDFPGGFAGDPSDAFTAAGRTEEQQRTFENLRRMLALRKAHPALRGPTTKVLVADEALLVYLREGGGERAVVAINASDVALPVTAELGGAFPDGTSLADALEPSRRAPVAGGRISLRLAPQSAAVLFRE